MSTLNNRAAIQLTNTILRVSVILFFVFGSLAGNARVPDGITVSLNPIQSSYAVDDKVLVEFAYRNTSDATIEFLIWGTALEGRIDEDILSIEHNGDELPYVGRHYKRAAPTRADYIAIASGSTVRVTVDLLTGYNIDYKGGYLLNVRESAGGQRQKQAVTKIALKSDRPISLKQTPIVNSCSASREVEINSALSAAESITRVARDALQNTPIDQRANARRYTEWFGNYSEQRWNAVQRNFNRIFSTVSGRQITFNCDDTTGAFAYVFPSDPYKVFLGRAFWNAPRTGTDSKAGTIVHELSHFTVVADTDDVVYGQSGARNLARSNPNNAIRNADSHEYFAENTPNLPMPSGGSTPVESGPDLIARAFGILTDKVFAGRTLEMSANIENSGRSASTGTQVIFKLSRDDQISNADTDVAQATISALNVGESETIEVSFTAPNEEVQFWVGLCIAPVNGELETSNNCSSALPLILQEKTVLTSILLLLLDLPLD